jgi:hypothetical protein
MPKERARRGAAADAAPEADMEDAGAAGDAPAAAPLGDVAPMALFPPISAAEALGGKLEWRKVAVPQHRMTPLKDAWMELYTPVTEQMKIDMRMNLKTRKARRCAGASAARPPGFAAANALGGGSRAPRPPGARWS